MPILVLEMPGEVPETNNYFFDGTVTTYNNGNSNTLNAEPTDSLQVTLRNMTNKTNTSKDKCDYFLRFDSAQNLLGIGSAKEYILLGSNADKSLIRNYIGYQLAAKIMSDAPGFQLCEVFFHTLEGDVYQGVYLLVEKTTPETSVLFYHGTKDNGIAIDTYSSINGTTVGKMYIPFMESPQWDDRYSDVIGGVSTAESVLYSTTSSVFYTYPSLFDVTSFVERFILGELMEDYVGVTDSYFYYDTKTSIFSPAPIWDFSLALDNQRTNFAEVDSIRYDEATYYEQFFKSHQFATQIQNTYRSLRNDVLNESALMQLIDDSAAYVAPAVERDWLRWNAYSKYALRPITEAVQENGTKEETITFSRQTTTYEDELFRLKYQLREHSLNMAFNLTSFDFSEKEISKEIVLNSNPVWLVLFLVGFFSLVRFARRYGV